MNSVCMDTLYTLGSTLLYVLYVCYKYSVHGAISTLIVLSIQRYTLKFILPTADSKYGLSFYSCED